MTTISVTVTTEIPLDVETAAKWFWGLSDEDQAQFLIEVDRISRADVGYGASTQWSYMIGHLQTCECSNDDARQMVRDWASYLERAA